MAKQKKKTPWLALGMLLYAAVFLTGTFFGLKWFWGFIEDYEYSRPKTAIDAYMAQLDHDHICQAAQAQIAALDGYLQSPEQCYALIEEATAQGITYARNAGESSESQNVYVLLSGTQPIGQVRMVPGRESSYGFAPWELAQEEFDFSFLTGTGCTVTVPHDYTVHINGVALDSSYITQDHIPYDALSDFYADYPELPYKVTYTSPALWGVQTVTVTDPSGTPVTIEETTDLESLLPQYSGALSQALSDLAEDYIHQYVRFISCSNETRETNYARLARYIVPGSELLDRMKDAIWGLRWTEAQNATVTEITLHRCVQLTEDQYLCDLTYNVFTKRYSNSTDTQTDLHLVIQEYEGGLRVLSMASY